VPAGHDWFSAGSIEEHLGPLREALGLSERELMSLGRTHSSDEQEGFCMTVLALRMSSRANAVSSLHGQVSRAMWRSLTRAHSRGPIGHITNGVHVHTWLAPQMRQVYDRHLGPAWPARAGEQEFWDRVDAIDNGELWETHLTLKKQLIEVARRFATYKRATLILPDIEQLAALVNNAQMPTQFVFAGKSHPLDGPGKAVLQEIARLTKDPRFVASEVPADVDVVVAIHWRGRPVALQRRPHGRRLRDARVCAGGRRDQQRAVNHSGPEGPHDMREVEMPKRLKTGQSPAKRTATTRPAAAFDSAPTHDAIAMRAYELFLQRGARHGQDFEDWLAAERERQPTEVQTA
jgi:hypothetical protein